MGMQSCIFKWQNGFVKEVCFVWSCCLFVETHRFQIRIHFVQSDYQLASSSLLLACKLVTLEFDYATVVQLLIAKRHHNEAITTRKGNYFSFALSGLLLAQLINHKVIFKQLLKMIFTYYKFAYVKVNYCT